MIKFFFTNKELLQLVTSNFYSVLYYASEICHIPSLICALKQKLLSSSARALKCCMKSNCEMIFFEDLHLVSSRATPQNLMIYMHELLLHKLYNGNIHDTEWINLNFMSKPQLYANSHFRANKIPNFKR